MKKTLFLTTLIFATFLLQSSFFTTDANAQRNNEVYDEGTVWEVTTVRMDANMEEEYLKRLSKTWNQSMKLAKKEGLIVSYKILNGAAANQQDYNLLLMVEFKNMATLDPDPATDAKWKAISDQIEANPEFKDIVKHYGQIRQLFGSKLMREIYLK